MRILPLLLAVASTIACGDPAAGQSVESLRESIRKSVAAAGLGTSLACTVIECSSGEVLFDANGTLPFKPASNLKVFTSGAALRRFGPEFKFRTSLLLDRSSRRLTVLGDGDPAFGDPKVLERMSFTDASGTAVPGITAARMLDWWVDAVVRSGQTSISELVIDARVFDRECYNPTWPTDQRSRPYCAEVWGFNYHANMMLLGARAGDAGRVTIDKLEPNYAWIISRETAQVGAAKSKSTFVVTRDATSNALSVSGRLPARTSTVVDLSVHDTPSIFLELFARALRSRGIEVATTRVARSNDPAPTGESLGVIETPISVVLERTNTDSANLYAECLLKRLGAASVNQAISVGPTWIAGSWSNGTTALRNSVQSAIGPAAQGFVIADGCGLSHSNRITSAGQAAWLRGLVSENTLAQPFLQSLAVAGETGTVKDRFSRLDGNPVQVRCKTGYINGVSTLSGVVEAPHSRKIAFSVLGNNLEKIGTDRARKAQESVVYHIVDWLNATSKPATVTHQSSR
jgi:D-alanyl-D-alanine carboxypeptidase/D-alanyl-D-alanine-endopeptidase (penicillin-binding protein 4)